MAEIVPVSFRTANIQVHMFSSLLGRSLGPIIWILSSQFEGDFHMFSSLYLNRFTINFSSGGVLCILVALTSWYYLGHSPSAATQSASNDEGTSTQSSLSIPETEGGGIDNIDGFDAFETENDVVDVNLSDGSNHRVNTKVYQRNTFRYFLFLMFAVAGTTGLVMVAFQPILIGVFNSTGKQIGVIYTCVLICGLIPPVLVAFLSKYLQDRQIMLAGLLIKLVGIILYLPISSYTFGIDAKITELRVIVGFILVCKGSMFFWASGMSLFTTLLGPMSNSSHLTILSSAAQIGPALAQLFFAHRTIHLFGSFYYGVLALPLLAAIFMVIWPSRWRRLDPDDEFTKVLLRQYQIVQSRRKEKYAE